MFYLDHEITLITMMLVMMMMMITTMVMLLFQVPLFKTFTPAGTISLVQKLIPSIILPGELIVRQVRESLYTCDVRPTANETIHALEIQLLRTSGSTLQGLSPTAWLTSLVRKQVFPQEGSSIDH